MNRRNLLKVLGISAVGVATVPLWMDAWTTDKLPADTFDLGEDQKVVLAELVETYIPGGDIPGAKELEVDLFVRAMVSGCFQKDVQKEFRAGFKELDTAAQEEFGNAFAELSKDERLKLVTTLESAEKDPNKKIHFVSFVKDLTISGYMSSQYILENHMGYEFIPARFNGSFPVEKTAHRKA